MIIYLQTIFLSLIQAITEFLPVSSSGHLIIFHKLLSAEILNNLSFDVALHGGSLLAIIIFFYKDIQKIFYNFLNNFKQKTLNNDLAVIIIISIVPAGLMGFFLEDLINVLRKSLIVAFSLIFGSILFILAEKFLKNKRRLNSLNIKDGILIGLAQCLAFIPGMSRSGITIVAGMGRGFSRTDSAKFSFLLAIPLLLGAFIKKIIDSLILTNNFNIYFVLGFFLTFFFSLIVIKLLMKMLKSKFSLYAFAFYRIILALFIFLFF